jgi:hypothetical protein
MAKVTIELPAATMTWLEAEAARLGLSVAAVLTARIAESAGAAGLDAHEGYVLRLVRNVSAKPGWPVPVRALWTNWQLRGSLAELSKALEGLARRELVVVNQGFTEVRLTEAGFSAGR